MPETAGASPQQTAGRDGEDGPQAFLIHTADGVELSGEQAGSGKPVVLLHGLTASRRYVVHGSRALERSGHRVIAYDARGHGRSSPPPGGATRVAGESAPYGYRRLSADLKAVLDATGVQRAVLAGVSMGSHTIIRFALEHPERVAALAIITPAYDPTNTNGAQTLASWDVLAHGLRERGIEGFIDAYELDILPESMRATVATVIRQRLALHEHLDAVADALEAVPRSRPFGALEELAAISVPTVVVVSRDEFDPRHPLAVGENYARTILDAQLRVEAEGASPLAWQGGQVSKIIAELAGRASSSSIG